MKTELLALAKKHNYKVSEQNNTFNLGENIRNVPHNVIVLEKSTTNSIIKATCEFVYGTSTKPNYYTGNLTDNNIFRIKAEFKNDRRFKPFTIISNSAIRKYFFKSTFSISCKDKSLAKFLKQNSQVKNIYDLSYNSAEISPMIEVEVKNNQVFVDVNYQSFETNMDILENTLLFCETLSL